MNMKHLVAAAALTIASATATMAATVNVDVDGKTYEVGTVVGTFDDLFGPTLSTQVWYASGTASDFALEVGGALGFPNVISSNNAGPLFLDDTTFGGMFAGFLYYIGETGGPSSRPIGGDGPPFNDTDQSYTWAVATEIAPVPLPAGALLLLTGLAGAVGLKRWKARAATA